MGSGRWQRPCPGVFVTHSGPLTTDDELWMCLLWAGGGAVLAGLTAARLDGLTGFSDGRVHVLLPDSRQVRKPPPGLPVCLHRSRSLDTCDVHPAKSPPGLKDISGGAEALSGLDFTRLVIRAFGLPEPTRQMVRYDSRGRRRWLDVVGEGAGIIVEIDAIYHMDAVQWWDDMDRENGIELDGYLVLRFTAFVVRYRPDYVASQIRDAFRRSGHALTA